MNAVLEENFPKSAAALLEKTGFHVWDPRATELEGATDSELFQWAKEKAAVFFTTDRDFYHTVPALYSTHHGVVVIALRRPNRTAILSKVSWLLSQSSMWPLTGKVNG